MSASAQKVKGVFDTTVVSNTSICREHYRLVLQLRDFPQAEPGQFVQVLCRNEDDGLSGDGPMLRRPFSIGGLRRDSAGVQVDIIHRVVGRGTGWLARLSPGDAVNILGPLGNPFAVVDDRPVAWLVGGGVGLPPMIWLAEKLSRAGKQVVAFCGARTAELMPLTRCAGVAVEDATPALSFAEFADNNVPVVAATDDGSLGAVGSACEAFSHYLDAHAEQVGQAVVYSCGPEPMLRIVAQCCESRGLPCQVCMERVMACGMGTCQSCVVRLNDETDPEGWSYHLCCTDGPVFDSRQIIWDK